MQTYDEQMLKISRQYLDLRRSYDQLTENLVQQDNTLKFSASVHHMSALNLQKNF